MSDKPAATPDPKDNWKERTWNILFMSDTPAAKLFDVVLLWVIGASVLVVMLESVDSFRERHLTALRIAEWAFTGAFTIEYLLRLYVARNPWSYFRSFFGIVDLISILPTYLELLLTGTHYLMVVRVLRLLRMFRVLKMVQHLGEASTILNALIRSRHKIGVFLFGVMTVVCVEGTFMYLLEHDQESGFDNIPQSIYWAIVTITTVGYGDIAPVTVLGKMMASVIMLTGFAIIAVPTGIVTAEFGRELAAGRADRRRCRECGWDKHDIRARHCNQCGSALD